MAQKKKSSRSSGNPMVGANIPVKISLVHSDSTPTFYVNHADVGGTPHDFSLSCGRISPKISPAEMELVKSTHALALEALVQIVFPPTLMPGLIRALMTQKEMYEKQFGRIKDSSSNANGVSQVEH